MPRCPQVAVAGLSALALVFLILPNPHPTWSLAPASVALAQPTPSVSRGPYLQRGTPNSIVIRWRTDLPSNSRVRYGSSPGSLTQFVDDLTVTTEHEVVVSGLTPNATYYYSVGTTTMTLAGGDANHLFMTAPASAGMRPTRVWVIGDSGTADLNAAAVRNAYMAFTGARYTDVWLMLGDNAYQDGTDAEYQSAVFNMYPSLLRQTILWPTLGNHDGHTADSATQTGPYYNIFTLPKMAEAGGLPSGTEAYYSFDFGNIHFICLESFETNRSPGSPMLTWLQNDLATTTKPWIVAFWHHPPYTKGSHNSDTEIELIEMRQNALPILEAYGVDLVLTGHSHSYERSFLIDGHYGPSTTFMEIMKRDGGSGRENETGAYRKPPGLPSPNQGAVYAVAGSSGQISGGPLNHPAMFISLNSLGSMVLDVDGNRMDARFLDHTGVTRDYFTILKQAPTPLPLPWLNQDVGTVAAAGSASHSAGTFTIRGSGANIWSTADAFHFVYQPLNGNGQITARVVSLQDTHPAAKVGVMMRENLSASSRHVILNLKPNANFELMTRSTTGGSTTFLSGGPLAFPYYVRLTRSGSTITGHVSSNGTAWVEIGSTTLALPSTVYVGIPVNSHNDGVLTTAIVDNVSVAVSTAPTVGSVSPNSGPTSGGTPVTIAGTNFTSPATVTFGGTSASPVTVVSGTQITTTTPARPAGPVNVTVTTSAGSGTLINGFTYTSGTGFSLAASPSTVAAGATVTVSWTAPGGRPANDWIGLYSAGAPNTSYLWWAYTGGAASGSFAVTAPVESGQYEFRYLLNDGYTHSAQSNPFTVTQGVYTLTVNPTSLGPGESLTLSWTAPSGRPANDWIGLYRVDDGDASFLSWFYTGGAMSGTLVLSAPTALGSYDFRYFVSDSYTRTARSEPFMVR